MPWPAKHRIQCRAARISVCDRTSPGAEISIDLRRAAPDPADRRCYDFWRTPELGSASSGQEIRTRHRADHTRKAQTRLASNVPAPNAPNLSCPVMVSPSSLPLK